MGKQILTLSEADLPITLLPHPPHHAGCNLTGLSAQFLPSHPASSGPGLQVVGKGFRVGVAASDSLTSQECILKIPNYPLITFHIIYQVIKSLLNLPIFSLYYLIGDNRFHLFTNQPFVWLTTSFDFLEREYVGLFLENSPCKRPISIYISVQKTRSAL